MKRCAHCGSLNTQAGLDRFQCLDCGECTLADGTAVAPSPRYIAPPSERQGVVNAP